MALGNSFCHKVALYKWLCKKSQLSCVSCTSKYSGPKGKAGWICPADPSAVKAILAKDDACIKKAAKKKKEKKLERKLLVMWIRLTTKYPRKIKCLTKLRS